MKLDKEIEIVNFLKDLVNIDFAIVFGSIVSNKMRYDSDVDFAIHFTDSPTILEIGEIVLGLENIIKTKVDIVSLNNLYLSNPELAYNVISEGKTIIVKDEFKFIEFKKSVLLFYLDFKPYIEKFNTDFNQRLSSNKFAIF